ncbi:MAG TPA: Na+/H+ antiporter subunit E [Trebonia sp.]|jgi:multisubunit Na+/H+ antiporter MnhE subunit
MAKDSHQQAHKHLAVWAAWWVLLMALWVMLDDSLQFDELLAGAGAAAIAAGAAVIITAQAGARPGRPDRAAWALAREILGLPGQVVRDTATVFGALGRTLVTGRQPDSGFAEVPVRYGHDTPAGEGWRVLLTGVRSFAPNTFVVGLDGDRSVMALHRLVRLKPAGIAGDEESRGAAR